jgi:DNA-directed RNA polymerase subunit RPC12/RpoP
LSTYICKECGFSYSEADKNWHTQNPTNLCQKCGFHITNEFNERAKKVKIGIVTITALLTIFAVLTNDKPIRNDFGYIVIIFYLMFTFILPYIEDKAMGLLYSSYEYKKDNLLFRSIFLIFSVIYSIFILYELFIN